MVFAAGLSQKKSVVVKAGSAHCVCLTGATIRTKHTRAELFSFHFSTFLLFLFAHRRRGTVSMGKQQTRPVGHFRVLPAFSLSSQAVSLKWRKSFKRVERMEPHHCSNRYRPSMTCIRDGYQCWWILLLCFREWSSLHLGQRRLWTAGSTKFRLSESRAAANRLCSRKRPKQGSLPPCRSPRPPRSNTGEICTVYSILNLFL